MYAIKYIGTIIRTIHNRYYIQITRYHNLHLSYSAKKRKNPNLFDSDCFLDGGPRRS